MSDLVSDFERASCILDAARARGVRIALAESCTGGMVAAALSDVPGASDVFDRGFVTYSNAAKTEMLGVTPEALRLHGAVSEEVARQMAQGALAALSLSPGSQGVSAAITGIAGPGGGSALKPEGRVCFAIASARGTHSSSVDFGALGRAKVREAARTHALGLLARAIEALR